MAKSENTEITDAQKHFCREYIYDWNGTRAYAVAYPGVTEETARANASRLLANANVVAYWKLLAEDDERYTGISRRMIILEHKKIIEANFAGLRSDWITLKEFNELTADQKACIAEIQTQTRQLTEWEGDKPIPVTIEFVKIKLYDKQKSLDSISKMLGFDAAKKIEVFGGVKSYKIVPASTRRRTRDSGE